MICEQERVAQPRPPLETVLPPPPLVARRQLRRAGAQRQQLPEVCDLMPSMQLRPAYVRSLHMLTMNRHTEPHILYLTDSSCLTGAHR